MWWSSLVLWTIITDSPNSASYLDHYLEHDINETLPTKFYDKCDDFNFPIVNYPFLDNNIPPSPAYGVNMPQLIRYSITCGSYQDFLHRSVRLTKNLLSQGVIETRLRSKLKKNPCRVSVTTMADDIFRPWYYCHEYVSFLDTT